MKRNPLMIGNLKARIPVIQGGMGVGISLSGLASAVASCGGIGVISTAQIGFREADYDEHPLEANFRAVKKEILRARTLSPSGILGVNIMTATREYARYVKAAVRAGIDLIISGAGVPADLPGYVHGSDTKIAPIVSSARSAQVILKLWDRKYHRIPDLLVIEGPWAGGHLGFTEEELAAADHEAYDAEIRSILKVKQKFEDAYGTRIPTAVAGGVYTPEDMDHYLSLGADAVQMSTRFVTTYECDADERYKNAYIQAKKEDIRIVKSPVGLPGRAIENDFIRRSEQGRITPGPCHQCLARCDRKNIPYCISEALVHAAKGELADALLFCGSNAFRAEKLEHVSDIMAEFAQ